MGACEDIILRLLTTIAGWFYPAYYYRGLEWEFVTLCKLVIILGLVLIIVEVSNPQTYTYKLVQAWIAII